MESDIERKILAIDPGTQVMGWCVISGNRRIQKFIDGGATRVSSPKAEIGLLKIFKTVLDLIVQYSPEIVVVESPFYGENTKTLIRLGEARGAILLASATAKLPIAQITPAEVKLALTGNGNARKEQVAYMVKTILSPKKELPLDATDAAAVAVAFLQRGLPNE